MKRDDVLAAAAAHDERALAGNVAEDLQFALIGAPDAPTEDGPVAAHAGLVYVSDGVPGGAVVGLLGQAFGDEVFPAAALRSLLVVDHQ